MPGCRVALFLSCRTEIGVRVPSLTRLIDYRTMIESLNSKSETRT